MSYNVLEKNMTFSKFYGNVEAQSSPKKGKCILGFLDLVKGPMLRKCNWAKLAKVTVVRSLYFSV